VVNYAQLKDYLRRSSVPSAEKNLLFEGLKKDIIDRYLRNQQGPGEELQQGPGGDGETKTLSIQSLIDLQFSAVTILDQNQQKMKMILPPEPHQKDEINREYLHDPLRQLFRHLLPEVTADLEWYNKPQYINYLSKTPAFLFNLSHLKSFKSQLFFWDETATEEQLLNLIQETNTHLLQNVMKSLISYRSRRGAWLCLELQGEEEICEADLKEYYSDLEKYAQTMRLRFASQSTAPYCLTPHHLKILTQRKGRKLPAVEELTNKWEEFWEGEGFKTMMRAHGNPLPVYRSGHE
jgi:hypothetical protein